MRVFLSPWCVIVVLRVHCSVTHIVSKFIHEYKALYVPLSTSLSLIQHVGKAIVSFRIYLQHYLLAVLYHTIYFLTYP